MENSKKDKIYRIIMLIVITATITFMITSIGVYNYLTKTPDGIEALLEKITISKNTEDLNKKFELIKQHLEQYYIGEIDEKSMAEMALKGYVAGLGDEYTEYLLQDEYEELMVSVTGDYIGIGIYMASDVEGNIVVLMPIKNSPAEEAGLKEGDKIISIDGESCVGMETELVSNKIKGKEGTKVELEILRGDETIKKTIERRTVKIEDSRSEVLEGNIGYIQLSTFDTDCSKNIKNYLLKFKEQGINSVIIDLRDNTGGIVTEAIDFSELFVEKGNIIMRSYNKIAKETVVESSNSNPFDMNVVILVNEYSASATEIVTAALKDNGAATIVGTVTYGKGVMQNIVPLSEGNGALKVTVEEFKTPKGDKINKVGNTETKEDEQLQKAIEILK